jgi:hypothetical protein
MASPVRLMSKAEGARVLQRVGIPSERIDEIMSELSDPFDLDGAAPLLERFGVTHDRLMDSLGGSP